MIPVAVAAYFFFGFNLLDLGLALVAFFALLVLTSWSLGLLSPRVILRTGSAPRSLPGRSPSSCCRSPASITRVGATDWLQPVALALPPTHVFEGMRSILLHGVFDANELWWALGLNAIYLTIGYLSFRWFLQSAKVNGTLVQLGE
jgi:ABC-2 type transport system permease protein